MKLVLGLFAGMLAIGAASFWLWRTAPPAVSCVDRVVSVSVFVAAGSTPVRLSWSEEREMVIESPAPRVLVAETSWRNVGVRVRLVR